MINYWENSNVATQAKRLIYPVNILQRRCRQHHILCTQFFKYVFVTNHMPYVKPSR